MHESCGCRITAITPAFQAGDVGSTPIIRLFSKSIPNIDLQVFNPLENFIFFSLFDGLSHKMSHVFSVSFCFISCKIAVFRKYIDTCIKP